MTDIVYENINQVVQMLFDANAQADNFAYNLDYMYFNEIADLYHHSFAHLFPQLSDIVTDEMLKLSARPVRLALNKYVDEYNNLQSIFADNLIMVEKLRDAIIDLIAVAELNDDIEVKIFFEDFLNNQILCLIKQSEEWLNASKKLSERDMNIHIKEYTHFINII